MTEETKTKKKRGPAKTGIEKLEAERDKATKEAADLTTRRSKVQGELDAIDVQLSVANATKQAFEQAIKAHLTASAPAVSEAPRSVSK